MQRGQECLAAEAEARAEEVASLLEEQGTLEARRRALAAAAAPARAEREGLEHHTAALRAAAVALQAWLEENEARVPDPPCADDAVQPEDALARQALEAATEDAGIEDALYSLGKALEVRCRIRSCYSCLLAMLCRCLRAANAGGQGGAGCLPAQRARAVPRAVLRAGHAAGGCVRKAACRLRSPALTRVELL